MNLLLAFPRTASTWTRYIVEFFTSQTCDGYYDKKSVCQTIKDNNIETLYDIKDSATFMTMIHHQHEIRNRPTKLILSKRNPVEVLPSFYYSKDHKNKKISIEKFMQHLRFSDIHMIANLYKQNIKYYESFAGEKIILDYENLMENPKQEIEKITKFLNCYNEERINSFMSNYEMHKKSCLHYKSLPKHMSVNTSGNTSKIANILNKTLQKEIELYFQELK